MCGKALNLFSSAGSYLSSFKILAGIAESYFASFKILAGMLSC
jgi:hypothetical protein